MEYAHEELMNELGVTQNDVPSEIKKQIISFNRKRRMALKPESIALLEGLSDDIASDITAWHYANSDDEEDEDEEEEHDTDGEREDEPLLVEKPVVVVVVEKPILQEGGAVISHVQNIEVQEEQKQVEKKNSGWGINLDW
jgi:hypothetical protein